MLRATTAMRASLFALTAAVGLAGCSTTSVQQGEIIEPLFTPDRILQQEGVTYAVTNVSDPWEGFNRTIYRFNYRFDRYVFVPAANAYRAVVPHIARQGINNFFNNWRDFTTLINSVLQLNAQKSLETTARVAWNSTLGLAGFIDVASGLMDLPRHNEDFGQTMGYWGIGPGPYLVLPILGPASVRDGIGLGLNWYTTTVIRDGVLDLSTPASWGWTLLNAVDLRSTIPFRYYETGSPFEYDMVRWLYSTKRQIEIDI